MMVREMKIKWGRKRKCFDRLDQPEKVFDFFKKEIGDDAQESVVILCLDNKNTPLGWFRVSSGTVSETLVHPREVFKSAVMRNASSVVMCHNHPSGDLTPSKEDISTSERLSKAGKILGIVLLDSIIISDTRFLSLREGGHVCFD